MDNLIIFDSDFLIANVSSISDILKKLQDYELYITEVSIKEITAKRISDRIGIIDELKKRVPNYSKLGIEFKKDNEEMKQEIKKICEGGLKKIFENKLIRNHDHNIGILMDRAYSKTPPFGKSDKGFKDTIIILDIKDFIKGMNVKKAFFVTCDDDYIKNTNEIQNEILKDNNCDFHIVNGRDIDQLLNYFNVGSKKQIEELSQEINNISDIDINKLRDDLNDICNKLFHFEGYDPYEGEYIGDNFRTNEIISKQNISIFLDNLEKNIQKNIFNTKVYISDFFDNFLLFIDQNEINIEIFEKLNDIYNKIKNKKQYKDAIINLLYENFIKLYNVKEEDLSF